MQLKLSEIATFVNGELDGDESITIHGIAKIEEAQENDLTFIANPKYQKYIENTSASAVLVEKNFPKVDIPVIRTENPYFAFLKILKMFHPDIETLEPGVHPMSVVSNTSKLGENVAIGAFVYIGKNCILGNNVKLYPGVVISDNVHIGNDVLLYPNVSIRERVEIGNNVIIHNGAVIGSDGFGFAREGDSYQKIPQVGTVVIEDSVEIGSNCSIDRATLGETRIKKGVKLDNLIQIAHNVEVGEHTVIAAQTGISGSSKIGKHVVIGGQVGFAGHIDVGDNITIGGQSGVSKNLKSNGVFLGFPAKPIMQVRREEASLRKLPDLIKKVRALERHIKDLKRED